MILDKRTWKTIADRKPANIRHALNSIKGEAYE